MFFLVFLLDFVYLFILAIIVRIIIIVSLPIVSCLLNSSLIVAALQIFNQILYKATIGHCRDNPSSPLL